MKFIKQHWFVLGLVMLLAIAAVRRNWAQQFIQRTTSTKIEKYTAESSAFGQEEAAQSGFFVSNKSGLTLPDIDPSVGQAFVRRFSQVVQGEQQKFGVPASALLACAYVNSFAGKRPLAAESHNYFALPCTPDWTGQTLAVKGRCYRKPATAWESFRDFSLHLKAQDWYAEAKRQAGRHPDKWLRVMAENGLSDVEGFYEHAREVINAYNLQELD